MRFSNEVAATLFAISLSTTVVLAGIIRPLPDCVIPPETFKSLDQPFTLSILQPALADGGPFSWIPLRITPPIPSKKKSSRLVIGKAHSTNRSSQLILKNQQLIAYGFPAKVLPFAETLPRPLAPFFFGGDPIPANDVKLFASYTCDDNNELYLELLADPSNNATIALAVESEVEGAQVGLKPLGYKGPAPNLPVKIDQIST